MIKNILISVFIGLILVSQSFAQSVSIGGYNMISTDSRILKIVFPPESPIEGKPIFSDDHKTAMIRFSDDAEGKAINGVIETVTGKYILNLRPTARISPQVIRIGNENPSFEKGDSSNPNMEFIPVISAILQGELPRGYQKESYAEVVDYGKFKAYPISSYTNNKFVAIQYELVATGSKFFKVEASQFYELGVKAVQLDDNLISTDNKPKLIVVRNAHVN